MRERFMYIGHLKITILDSRFEKSKCMIDRIMELNILDNDKEFPYDVLIFLFIDVMR